YAFSLTLLSGCAEPRGIAGDTLLAAAGNRQSVGLNVLRHHAAGGDHGAVTDLHRRHQGRIRADEGAGADIGVILAETVVVAGDRAGADIGFGTDAGIADIGQVIDLGAGLDARLLHLDEIADMRLRPDLGARTQPRVRADRGAGLNARADDVAVAQDGDIVADRDARAEDHERLDHHLAAEHRVGLQEYRLGRHHGDAGQQGALARAPLHGGFGHRQFGAVVDAHDLDRIGLHHAAGPAAGV